jgi:hypothetical protein
MTKQKVALFQRIGDYSYLTTRNFSLDLPDEDADSCVSDGYVRLSPWIEIEFPSLDTGDVIKAQLAQLDKAEQKAREELQQRLNVINDTRKRILALSFKPAEG